ncbi:hypothetical protein ALI44B_04635 [Leifsonia sp. ALI-44-B]|uniref:helix-turn-helix domain-containing protein n=1 Tax=Leifsonia sp. ALI-44-B TaxID=1933776 RepID=UPI00097C612E|nr:helix-turn-helix domain-containing protein [Leifsonia sp. ALI-44-B]ONI63917.1 hypothetical protein ALI44B_04635 [Leifsonia sp. ALI-44-B]
MSWQATDWADQLPYDVVKPLATRVLFKLANVAAQDGTRAWRSKYEMAEELGVHQKSIGRALRELQDAHLIRLGDQRAVAHIRADRRPTVYDMEFGWHRMFAQPEIPLPQDEEDEPEEAAPDGGTELSTGSHGGTHGGTAAVPLGTNGTTYNQLTKEPYVPERAQALIDQDECKLTYGHRRDAEGTTCVRCGASLYARSAS